MANARLKPTQNPKQAYITAGLVLVAALVFGLVVLPRFDPERDRLDTPAPDFALDVIHQGEPGARQRLSHLRGKPVLLDFWASWCMPCRAQAPIVDAVARHYGERIHVLGVDTGDEEAAARAFAMETKLSYPSVYDGDGSVARVFQVTSLPTLILLDAEGNIRLFRARVLGQEELKAAIDRLL